MEARPLIGAFLIVLGLVDALIGIVPHARVTAFARGYPPRFPSLALAGIGVRLLIR